MRAVVIETDTIQLDQFLKWTGIAGTGGQAKILIGGGKVTVNGTVVTARSRKLKPGDVVVVAGYGAFTVNVNKI